MQVLLELLNNFVVLVLLSGELLLDSNLGDLLIVWLLLVELFL